MKRQKILVVDDEIDFLHLLQRTFSLELDCETIIAQNGKEALNIIHSNNIDVYLIDMKMPGMNGLELLNFILEHNPRATVIIMTAYGCVDLAVESIKHGAYDFITKPFDMETIIFIVKKGLERSALIYENIKLQQELNSDITFQGIVGISPKMQKIYDLIQTVAKTDVNILITGESGTGKNLVAKAIHKLSPRNKFSFIVVNCPTIPEHILESELFGYKKGAFTHAVQNKKGLFQEAEKGTIFLDEIGEIPFNIQTKLLYVLQDKVIKPLGDTKSITVDVRVIASTNKNLKKAVDEKKFREDLYYRLNVISIRLPPLRERKEDIPLLMEYFLKKHRPKLVAKNKYFSPKLVQIFQNRHWKGNVRELENMVIRGILFSPGEEILPEHIGLEKNFSSSYITNEQYRIEKMPYKEAKKYVLQQFHEQYLKNILTKTNGNVSQAARKCKLERQALQQIIKKYGIAVDNFRSKKHIN